MSTHEQKHSLYTLYLQELDAIQPPAIPRTEKEGWQWCEDYINSGNAEWLDIYSGERLAGFLIIGTAGIEKHPDSDFSIAEAFVLPGCRGMGLMTGKVTEYVKSRPGIYSLIVLKENAYARHVWKEIFAGLGYEGCALDEGCVSNPEEVDLMGFRPSKTKRSIELSNKALMQYHAGESITVRCPKCDEMPKITRVDDDARLIVRCLCGFVRNIEINL